VTAQSDSVASSSLSGTAIIIINILDLNDNSPVFTFPSPSNDTVHVSSATPVGHVVARLAARDDDAGDNARLTFGCRPATTKSTEAGSDGDEPDDFDMVDDAFSVAADDGTVTVSQSLTDIDFRVYYIPLYVVDSGQPVRSGSGTLRIVVNRTIPFSAGGASARFSPGDLLALLPRRDGLVVYVAIAVAAGCCLLVTAPLAALRRRLRQRRCDRGPSGKSREDRVDGEIVHSTDSLMGSLPPPPPPSASGDVSTVRAAVSPYKRNGVVPTSQSLRCLTDDVDVCASLTFLQL